MDDAGHWRIEARNGQKEQTVPGSFRSATESEFQKFSGSGSGQVA
jgi:hypothetical protein